MIDLSGNGVLALWNGVEPTKAQEYGVWHTREHVPERISVPGILGARRYFRLHGPLPQFLTLYGLENIDVLMGKAYQALLENPTAWSISMRPALRDFFRLCCRRIYSIGGGLGSTLVAATVGDGIDLKSLGLRTWAQQAVGYDAITAAHLLECDPDAPDVPFAVNGAPPSLPKSGVLMLEGYGADLFPAAVAHLARLKLDVVKDTTTAYQFVYGLDSASLDHVARMTRKV